MLHKFVILLSLGVLTLFVSGCTNTFNGAGKDMENMGRSLQETFN